MIIVIIVIIIIIIELSLSLFFKSSRYVLRSYLCLYVPLRKVKCTQKIYSQLEGSQFLIRFSQKYGDFYFLWYLLSVIIKGF